MIYLIERAGNYYYSRRVPEPFREYDPRDKVRVALKTRDKKKALRLAFTQNDKLESYWRRLKQTGQKHSEQQYKALAERASIFGFSYYFVQELAQFPPHQIIQRIFHVAKHDYNEKHIEAVLGKVPPPVIRLEDALVRYWSIAKDQIINKTTCQVQKWENPRKKAIRNFVDCVGDKPIQELTRDDALMFRDWWIERVRNGEVVCATANKDFKHIKNIISTVADNLRIEINLEHVFKNLLLDEDDSTTRLPFETDYILNVLLNPERLAGLNEQAKWALHAFAETGAGFSELVGLLPEDIVLNAQIPHINIRRRKFHGLKTRFRPREIPLVGFALDAFHACPNGFTDYFERPDSLSTAVGKYLNENGMLPSEDHTTYSLRHSFQDRLIDVDARNRVQSDLMGHKFKGEKYGKGSTLEKKLEWLLKIQLKTHNFNFIHP